MKMHMIKKVSLLLVAIIVLFSPINIYAENFHQDLIGENKEEVQEEVQDEIPEEVQEEIKKEIEIARQEIYRQLKEQDALVLMEVYEELIYPQIEEQIIEKYIEDNNLSDYNLEASSRVSYYARNGGMLT